MHSASLKLPYGVTLASPKKRFLAALIDILFVYGFGILVLLFLIFIGNFLLPDGENTNIILLGIFLFCLLLPFVINLFLLEKYGQTLGKKFLNIQLVDRDGGLISIDRVLFLRQILPALLYHIPLLGIVFFIFDSILVFSKERQCFHDRIANTLVINVKAN